MKLLRLPVPHRPHLGLLAHRTCCGWGSPAVSRVWLLSPLPAARAEAQAISSLCSPCGWLFGLRHLRPVLRRMEGGSWTVLGRTTDLTSSLSLVLRPSSASSYHLSQPWSYQDRLFLELLTPSPLPFPILLILPMDCEVGQRCLGLTAEGSCSWGVGMGRGLGVCVLLMDIPFQPCCFAGFCSFLSQVFLSLPGLMHISIKIHFSPNSIHEAPTQPSEAYSPVERQQNWPSQREVSLWNCVPSALNLGKMWKEER